MTSRASSPPARSITSSARPTSDNEAENGLARAAVVSLSGDLPSLALALPSAVVRGVGSGEEWEEARGTVELAGSFWGDSESRVITVVMPRGESPKKSDSVGASIAEASGAGRAAKYGELRVGEEPLSKAEDGTVRWEEDGGDEVKSTGLA